MPTNARSVPVIISKAPPKPSATVTRGCNGSFSSGPLYLSSVVLMSSVVGLNVGVLDVEDVEELVVLVVKPEDSVDFGAALELVLDSIETVMSETFGLSAVFVVSSSSLFLLSEVGKVETAPSPSWPTVAEDLIESEGPCVSG